MMFLQATLQKKFDQSQGGQFWIITSHNRYVPTQEQFIIFSTFITLLMCPWDWQNNHMGCKKPALFPKLPFQPFNTNHSQKQSCQVFLFFSTMLNWMHFVGIFDKVNANLVQKTKTKSQILLGSHEATFHAININLQLKQSWSLILCCFKKTQTIGNMVIEISSLP